MSEREGITKWEEKEKESVEEWKQGEYRLKTQKMFSIIFVMGKKKSCSSRHIFFSFI